MGATSRDGKARIDKVVEQIITTAGVPYHGHEWVGETLVIRIDPAGWGSARPRFTEGELEDYAGLDAGKCGAVATVHTRIQQAAQEAFRKRQEKLAARQETPEG